MPYWLIGWDSLHSLAQSSDFMIERKKGNGKNWAPLSEAKCLKKILGNCRLK